MDDAATLPRTENALGRFRRFGPDGPTYEVLGFGRAADVLRIRVLESGEELDYRLDRALRDPEA